MNVRSLCLALLGLGFLVPEAPAAGGREARGLDRIPLDKILVAARDIDRVVEADLATHGQKPNPVADDATFVRRVYLDLIGRIPTPAEASAFLESPETDSRSALIDRLLASAGYESHLFNWFADLLRVKSKMKNASGEAYIDYLKTALAENLPYDRLVSELLTASGPAYKRGNGSTGYLLRDRGMPEDNMSNTIRVFLGTRLECAQCHNHPFDKWTQIQYFQMVAFTGGLQYRDTEFARSDLAEKIKEVEKTLKNSPGGKGDAGAKAFKKALQPLGYGISGTGTGSIRLPHDYKYPDAKPEQAVTAKTIFGADLQIKPGTPPALASGKAKKKVPARNAGTGVGSRDEYAEWLTSAENPRFATVIANRMWKRLLGAGVIEPVDDLKDDTVASNPALMDQLRAFMVDSDFDLKQFIRMIANSATYQRETSTRDLVDGETYRFPGPLLRRMSAEQIWDSMLTLVVPDLDKTLEGPGGPQVDRIYHEYDELSRLSKDELVALGHEGKKKLQADLKVPKKPGKKDVDKGLERASDLQQPAPAGHFVREFGQGDREQIEASHRDPAVPQALSLLNGFVEQKVIQNPKSAIMAALASARSPEDKIATAFLGILGRRPRPEELKLWIPDVREKAASAVQDLAWTLVNAHEFLFIR